MNYFIKTFKNNELDQLVNLTNLDEPIDYGCTFIVAKNEDIAGVAGVNLVKEVYPRFEHIVIAPKYQKSKLGASLMLRMENWLRSMGYYTYVSFIYHGKVLMHYYARKWGMKAYLQRPKGIWYFKTISGG